MRQKFYVTDDFALQLESSEARMHKFETIRTQTHNVAHSTLETRSGLCESEILPAALRKVFFE